MFLVDGSHVFGHARERLVSALSHLARSFGSPSAIVFGGVPGPCAPPQHGQGSVRVFYAGASLSVGARIMGIVAHDAPRKGITVVTSDPHLAACARESGARVAPMHLLSRALDGPRGSDYAAAGASTTWSRPARFAS
jgi:YacP-like NYN domain